MPPTPDKLDTLARQAKDCALHRMRTAEAWTSLPDTYGQNEGRFSGMMPPRKPGPEHRAKAAALLQALGPNISNRGFDAKWN